MLICRRRKQSAKQSQPVHEPERVEKNRTTNIGLAKKEQKNRGRRKLGGIIEDQQQKTMEKNNSKGNKVMFVLSLA